MRVCGNGGSDAPPIRPTANGDNDLSVLQDVRAVSPDLYEEQRYREGEFICDVCGDPWPRSHRRRQLGAEGGLYVGIKCCFEPEGTAVDLDLKRAFAAKMAARIAARETQHDLRGDDGVIYPGLNPLAGSPTIDYNGFVITITPRPVVLNRGGGAVAVTLTGNGFASDDTIVYGAAGITNSTAPVLNSSTQWTLSVQASGGMAVGYYTFTFNGTKWQAVFDVR